MQHQEWVRKPLPIFLGISCVAILSLTFVMMSPTTNSPDSSDVWFPQPENTRNDYGYYMSPGGTLSAPTSTWQSGSAIITTEDASNIGFATGGAQDIENFRKNIENDFLPLYTDITHEGLFHDYYFDTGKTQQCEKLFCPSYSSAISRDPLSEKNEYYLSVGLNSGMKKSDFERKKLNLVIVLDISSSMQSPFDRYYYDGTTDNTDSEDYTKTKIRVASESLAELLDHLNPDDRLGVVLFESTAHTARPLVPVGDNLNKLKENILNIYADGGTNMESGILAGTSLFDDMEQDHTQYENRIIFLTDAMPNTGQIHKDGLLGIIQSNAQNNIYTTVIGIGVDFNTNLVEHLTKTKGANYYSVHSPALFQQKMTDEFDFMVTPLVFDLVLKLESDGYEINQVYGSSEANLATGEIMRINTLFPSKTQEGQTKGGIVLLKLQKTSDDATITLSTTYHDRTGRTDGSTVTVYMEHSHSDYYENDGIRKGILLARYAELLQTWAFDERASHGSDMEPRPALFYENGIHVPDYVGNSLGVWERESIPLQVSGSYGSIISQFGDYFKEEMMQVDDPELLREVILLDKLQEYSYSSSLPW